jgi:4-amino-4-deoxy-L-arabinose transferase-like glycosyltransferase
MEEEAYRVRFILLACGAVAGVYALWLLAVSPRGDFPLNDDWAYAWSVRHLLETGELRISEWASAASVVPVYWGALFSRLAGGFSFTALRISTLVFGVVSPLALCWLLRGLDIPRPAAVLAAVALLANPLFVHLSYTFMSDVFYLSLMLLSLGLYANGIERNSAASLWAGSVIAAAAYLCRQLGITLPLAAVAVLCLQHRTVPGRAILRAAFVPFVVFAIHTWWLREVHGVTWAFQLNVIDAGLATLVQWSAPAELWRRLLYAMLYLGVFALPALVAVIASGRIEAKRARELAGTYLAWVLVLGGPALFEYAANGTGMPYLHGIINRDAVGTIGLNGTKSRVTPQWIFDLVTVLAPFLGAALATLWTDVLLNPRREIKGPGAVVLLSALLMAALTAPMAELFDEYLMVFVPASLYLVLREGRLSVRGGCAGTLVCAAMLAYVLPEQADYLAWNDASWTLGRRLVDAGVPAVEIAGGFEWIGWYDFEKALPLATAAGQGDNLFGWWEAIPDRYILSFEPSQPPKHTRLVGSVPYQTHFGSQGRVYALALVSQAP